MTQVVAAPPPPPPPPPPVEAIVEVPVDPIAVLATSFTAITTALEAHKSQDGAVETAKEAETRASEALTAAKDRTVTAKSVAASGVTGVMAALDSADTALGSVRDMFTA